MARKKSARKKAARKSLTPAGAKKMQASRTKLTPSEMQVLWTALSGILPNLHFVLPPRFIVITLKNKTADGWQIVGGSSVSGDEAKARRGDWICWVNMHSDRYIVDFFEKDARGENRNPFIPSMPKVVLDPYTASSWFRVSQSAQQTSTENDKYHYHVVQEGGSGEGPGGPDIIIE